jgi:glutathione S-transferase
MKLYYAPGACSLAPHIALEEVGAPFELSRVDFGTNQQTSAEYLRINPKARVPALVDGDWVLTEAPAILRYIAARHPAAGLWPWEPREEARCAEWLNWLSSTIQIAFGHVRRADRSRSARSRMSLRPAKKRPMNFGKPSTGKSATDRGRLESVTASPTRC